MKRALGACALILALAVAFMAPASAAQLVLTGGQHPFSSASARCDDMVTATTPPTSGTSSSVQVSGILAACTGTLVVRVYDSSGTSKATGSATVVSGGGSQTLTVSPAYSPSATDRVSVTIATWPIAATWTYTPPAPYIWCTLLSGASAGSTCTATVTLFHGTKPGGSGVADYYDVVVTTTSATPARWEVSFDLRNAFYGSVPAQLGNSILDPFSDGLTTWDASTWWAPANDVTTQGTCSAGQLSVRGTAAAAGKNDFRNVTDNRVRKFSLVVNQAPAGYGDVLTGGCA
ncbi:hypothetical protein BH11ACT1_BH11ACT1_16050 [soil metagenome]